MRITFQHCVNYSSYQSAEYREKIYYSITRMENGQKAKVILDKVITPKKAEELLNRNKHRIKKIEVSKYGMDIYWEDFGFTRNK